MRLNPCPRSGAAAVETAVVLPVVTFLIIGLIVGGLGVFRYHEMAHLAREAARYASVHGAQWSRDTGSPPVTADGVYAAAVAPNAVALDPKRLKLTVTYNQSSEICHFDVVSEDDAVTVRNTVTVTITYDWIPEAILGGQRLSATSVMPMSY